MMSILQEAFPTIVAPFEVVMMNYFNDRIVLADCSPARRQIVSRVPIFRINLFNISDMMGLLCPNLPFS